MATIKITDTDGKEYSLSFNLRTIKQMSDNGFNINTAADNYIVAIPQLFAGAFLRFHRTVPHNKIDEIWSHLENKDEIVRALVELYQEPVEEWFGEPDEEAKKAKWEVVK